jgi:hypothetical protein
MPHIIRLVASLIALAWAMWITPFTAGAGSGAASVHCDRSD